MKKGVLLIYCLLLKGLLTAFGQTSSVDYGELKIIPPSPSVAELGRFGLASAHLSDGSFTTQIPIYEYKTKNLTLPISLVYSTNGLQVNKVASRVGMDWSLMAGGSIGRMVLGYPDETKSWVKYPSSFPYTSGDSLQGLISNVSNHAIETVPDIYNFSFNGYSGRFLYINDSIIKLEQNSLDIEKTLSGFTVTDNSGIKYYFDKTESSLSSSNCAGNPYASSGYVTNAWMLTRIVHPLGDVIYLTYKTCNFTYSSGVSQTYISSLKNTPQFETCGCPGMGTTQQCVAYTINNGLMLDKIYSNYRGMMQCNYMARQDIAGDSALIDIDVYNVSSDRFGNPATSLQSLTPIHFFLFGYLFPTANADFPGVSGTSTSKRMYLQGIQADDKSYAFQYNALDALPPRLSFSQDQFGYFNGQHNASLIPAPVDLTDYNDFLSYGYGDRLPDYTYALNGTLSKIIYPTGGSDSIIYESHSVYHSGSFDCNNLNITNTPRADGNSSLKKLTSYFSDVFTVNCGQEVTVQVANLPTDESFPLGEYLTSAGLIQATQGSPIIPNAPLQFFNDIDGHPLEASKGQENSFQFRLSPGTYRLEVQVRGPCRGYATFTYKDDSASSGNISIAGLRVQSIITNTVNGPPLQKKYYYTQPNSNASSGLAVDEFPSYLLSLLQIKACQEDDANCASNDCVYNEYTSNDFYSLYSYGGNHIYYQTVLEDQGNNFANGYIEHDFMVSNDENAMPLAGSLAPGTPLINYGIYNGFEYQTKYFKNTGDSLKLFKQVNKDQLSDPRLSTDHMFYAFNEDQGMNFSCTNLDTTNEISQFEGLHVAAYDMLGRWLYNDSVTTTEYDDSGHILTTSITYAYANPLHQELTQSQTINSKGELITTKMFYPSDSVSLSDSVDLAAVSSLQANHMYNSLLEKQIFKDSSMLSDEQIHYTNNIFPVPVFNKHYKAIMGDTLELRTEVTGYGPAGTVLGVTTNRSDLTAYLWDYDHEYPVAEVKNALPTDIAYTSFEADGSGNWNVSDTARNRSSSITGNISFTFNSGDSIGKTGLNTATTYIVSYWTQNSSAFSIAGTISGYPTKGKTINGWTLYVHRVTGKSGIFVTGTGAIDELRLYPLGAQMTTYTYAPLIGMTSQCDVGNRVTYYQYDIYSRLQLILDQDHNILKTLEYQYQANTSCGLNCFSVAMKTLAGTNTLSYPVGVFNVHGSLLGNATSQSGFVSLWNTDTADAHTGTLVAGADSLHFQITLNTGKTLPSITGCRYYQVDLKWNQFDAVRNFNGAYVAFGDSTGMRLARSDADTPAVLAPNTTLKSYTYTNFISAGVGIPFSQVYLTHTYPDTTTTKTITFYHNDDSTNSSLDNAYTPATSLLNVTNLRGNLPAMTDGLGGSCYQQSSMTSVSGIINWNQISSVTTFSLNLGDGTHGVNNIGYAQDFMQNNKGLQVINITGASDTSFKLSRLKTGWNTYFTSLQQLIINDYQWHREDLSALTSLWFFKFFATDPTGTSVIDNIINQMAAGAGRNINNGVINITYPGMDRTAASGTAYRELKEKGWVISINGELE